MRRDMTERAFQAALARHGFTRAGYLGYYRLPGRGVRSVMVSVWNAGPTRREQLAYLLDALRREEAKHPTPTPEAEA